MEEARVNVKVDVPGLSDAIAGFGRLGSNAKDAAYRVGTADRLTQELRVGQLGPAQIESLLQRVRSAQSFADASIDQIMRSGEQAVRRYQLLLERGQYEPGALRRAIASGLPGTQQLERLPGLRRDADLLEQALKRLEVLQQRQGERIEGTFERWLPQATRLFANALALVGVGSATAIASQSLNRAVEFGVNMADIRAFIGRAGLNSAAMRAAGPYGLYPMEAGQIGGDILAAGYRGGNLGGYIDEAAGLGLTFGLGRRGFATAQREGVGGGTFQNIESFRRFGYGAGGFAQTYGLEPAQRQFIFESNKNLIESMTRWYGGKPVNVDEFWRSQMGLMGVMTGLNLPLHGAPIATQVMSTFAQGMTPIGRSFTDLITRGALLGLEPTGNQGMYLGTQRAIRGMLEGPDPFIRGLQGVAGRMGIQTGVGAQISGDQIDSFIAVLKQKFPEMATAVDQLANVGVDMRGLLTAQPGELPANLNESVQKLLQETRDQAQHGWRDADIDFVRKEISGLGEFIMDASALIKRAGPIPLAAGSAIGGMLPGALSFLGAAAGTGAMFGGPPGAMVGLGAGALTLGGIALMESTGIRKTIVDAALKYGIDPLLALGVARTESSLNPRAVNPQSGAAGLFQIMPENVKRFGLDPFDPEQNAEMGMRVLRDFLNRSGGDQEKALAGYGGFVTKDPSNYIANVFRDAARELTRAIETLSRSVDAKQPTLRPAPVVKGRSPLN